MRHALAIVLAASTLGSCGVRPAFVPKPQRVYHLYKALDEPAIAVPVGALWIDGYGATGPGAADSNLVTERGMTGISFDNDLQASLTLGLLKWLDVDPSYRDKVTARFSDLSVVRVKDVAALSGPAEQPRIIAALKAGTITITAANNVGLDVENRALGRDLPLFGRGTTASARTFTIDAKDMYFAVQIATLKAIRSERIQVLLATGKSAVVQLRGVKIRLSRGVAKPGNKADCAQVLVEIDGTADERIDAAKLAGGMALALALPRGDGEGGLFDKVTLLTAVSKPGRGLCSPLKISTALVGSRLERDR